MRNDRQETICKRFSSHNDRCLFYLDESDDFQINNRLDFEDILGKR